MEDQKEQLEMGTEDASFWYGYKVWSEEMDDRETSDYIEGAN